MQFKEAETNKGAAAARNARVNLILTGWRKFLICLWHLSCDWCTRARCAGEQINLSGRPLDTSYIVLSSSPICLDSSQFRSWSGEFVHIVPKIPLRSPIFWKVPLFRFGPTLRNGAGPELCSGGSAGSSTRTCNMICNSSEMKNGICLD